MFVLCGATSIVRTACSDWHVNSSAGTCGWTVGFGFKSQSRITGANGVPQLLQWFLVLGHGGAVGSGIKVLRTELW